MTEEVASGQLTLPRRGYQREVDQLRYASSLLDRLRNEPGVEAAAISGAMPGGPSAGFYLLSIQNVPDPDPTNRPVAFFVPASPDYFKTLGLELKTGRTFTEGDRAETQPVTVVDELFVRQFLGNRDPLTQPGQPF